MLSEFAFITFLDLLSGFSAIMIGLLFLTVKSKNQVANVFMTLFMWSLAWVILSTVLIEYLEENEVDFPDFLEFDTILFIIPSLFFYLLITLNRSFKLWYLLLFLPGILLNVLEFEEGGVLDIVFLLLFPIINLTLMIIAFKILIKHKKKAANYYSELEYKTLSWIGSIIITVLILHFFMIFGSIIENFNDTLGVVFLFLEGMTTSFIVYWVGYNGFFQAQLFQENSMKESILEASPNLETASQKTIVLDEASKEQFEELKSKIRSERLFQNPRLNLRILATNLGIKEKELSRLINQQSQTNFYQFINRFRVEEFKNLLQSPKAQQLSILGLAEEAGFSSKSTFYTAFKTLEGMTPKQYELSLKMSE